MSGSKVAGCSLLTIFSAHGKGEEARGTGPVWIMSAHIISAHIPLARTWSWDHTLLQGELRNGVSVWAAMSVVKTWGLFFFFF